MNVSEFLDKNVLIFDGAMGTLYGELSNEKCELANLNDNDRIIKIHKRYIKAGCNAIKSNTFGANTIGLSEDFNMVEKCIRYGFKTALNAVLNTNVFVFADIGPIMKNDENTFDEYCRIIDVFLDEGAENFLFETFGSDEYLDKLAQKIKNANPNAFILTQFAVAPDGFTRQGLSGELMFSRILSSDFIDALGFNCVSGAKHLCDYIKKFELNKKPVSIMPNAGYPTIVRNKIYFEDNSEYFSDALAKAVKYGVKIVGGCCGSTPEYIRKTALKLENISTESKENHKIISIPSVEKSHKNNAFLNMIKDGIKPIAVELDTPINANIEKFMEGARRLKIAGADAITIADCPLARARADSSLIACKIKRELGITPIVHMTCRDRNINATKALLLGLNIEGIDNVLTVTGDPVPSPLRDEIKAFFSFNSSVLARLITEMNETVMKTPFHISGALNVNAVNFESQLKKAENKIKNGVKTFFTQPILTESAFNNLKTAKKSLDANIFGGIIPVVSYRNACFMKNEISGIDVDDYIIELYKDKTREESTELAVKISKSIVNKIEKYVDGFYILTPFNRVDIIEKIINEILNNYRDGI